MSDDIAPILSDWAYEDGAGMQVRQITGLDGLPKIQMRLDLGLMQMELEGRPDGQRPSGFASLLDLHRSRAEAHRRQHGWYEGFELDGSDCAALRQEAMQYYHRRISFMALQEYERAVDDADHNLEILDLLKAFARSREDWLLSEQYRAFILAHRVQAQAMQHLQREDIRAAMLVIRRGIRQVREVFAEQDRLDELEDSMEFAVLDDLQRKLEGRYHVSHRQRLQLLLDDALRREDPDEAAEIRAQLRALELNE